MQGEKIDVKFGLLFPWHFLFLAALVLIVGFSLLADRTVLGLILITGSVFVLSGYSGTEINLSEKAYREYNAFLFIKTGEWKRYDSIEKIFVNSAITRQRMYSAHTSISSEFTREELNAFLKFSDGSKVLLLTRRNKKKLLHALGKVAATLRVPVVDNTEAN